MWYKLRMFSKTMLSVLDFTRDNNYCHLLMLFLKSTYTLIGSNFTVKPDTKSLVRNWKCYVCSTDLKSAYVLVCFSLPNNVFLNYDVYRERS